MNTRTPKSEENKPHSVANSVAQKKSNVKQGFGFVDNRPESIMQRKFSESLSARSSRNELIIQNMSSGERDAIDSTKVGVPVFQELTVDASDEFLWKFKSSYTVQGASDIEIHVHGNVASEAKTNVRWSGEAGVDIGKGITGKPIWDVVKAGLQGTVKSSPDVAWTGARLDKRMVRKMVKDGYKDDKASWTDMRDYVTAKYGASLGSSMGTPEWRNFRADYMANK